MPTLTFKILSCVIPSYQCSLLNIRYPRCPNGKSWVVLDSKAYAYAKLHKKPIGRCTGPSVFEYDYIAVPVYARIVSQTAAPVEFILFDSDGLHAKTTDVFDGTKALLHLMCKRDHPEVDQEASRQALIKAETIIMEGLRIPLQPVPVIDDNGYICVDPPVDIRRELLDHKEKFAVIEHDIQVLTAKIEYLAIRKGVTLDELDAGARQHLGAVVDMLVESATPRKHAKADPIADRSGPMEVAQTPPKRALAAVPSISPCLAPHTPGVKDSQVTAGDATPAVVRQQQRDQLAVALRSRAKTPVPAAPGNSGRVASSGRVGVMWNAEKQRYYVRIISARRQQVRLGSYEDKDEASYAYAAAAVVLRPNSRISCTVELSDADRQALAGCTEEILRLLVKYRRWNRWREWRAAMAGLDDAQAVETRSRRKGRASRASSDVEEVQAITPTTEDQPMAEEPEDRTEDYTDDDESVDDDAVYEPGSDTFGEDDGWEDVNHAVSARGRYDSHRRRSFQAGEDCAVMICSANAVGAVDAEATCTPIVANAPQGEEDTEAVKERLIDELMEGKDEDDEEGNGSGQSSSNDPCGENGSEEEQATKAPHSRKRIDAADGQVTREEFDALRDSQNDTAKILARLESHVLTIIRLGERRKRKRASTSAAASLGREALKRKRQPDDDEESTCDEDDLPAKVARHARHDKSPVLQTALDILPAEKAWKITDAIVNWEKRKGKLHNSPCENGASVRRIQKLAFDAIADAVCRNEVPYDNEKKSWKWGRHGLRLSSCGLECLLEDEAASEDEKHESSASEASDSERDG
ncbi:unnamed protein product [Closterium sp. NIES-64]|nr:unnamed protein product [Closterium sp. NIES-64]